MYGREGYHALFLKPIAEAAGCVYRQREYMDLYQLYKSGSPGLYYIEDVWYTHGEAPAPPWRLPPAATWQLGKIYPVLGNVQVFYTDGLYNYAHEAPCGKAGLLAKVGEPLVTDLFLPLYLELGNVEKTLEAARKYYRCGLPATPAELVHGVKNGRYRVAYLWLGWAPDLPLRPNPVLKKAVAGFWGLTAVDVSIEFLHAYGYPPPYLDVEWGPYRHNKSLVAEAAAVRRPGWMQFVEQAYPVIHGVLLGELSIEAAARKLAAVENYVEYER